MDADVSGLVPPAYAGAHLLALPCEDSATRPPLDTLARAWFPTAGWETVPAAPPSVRPVVGARFRGVAPVDEVRPGRLRLADGVRVVGPFPVPTASVRALSLRGGAGEAFALHVEEPAPRGAPAPVPDDRDGLARAFPAGLPQGVELQLLGWAVAAARRVGGAVVVDRRALLVPDPGASVDLTLYSPDALAPEDAVGVVRTVVPGARVARVDGRDDGARGFEVTGGTPYDGAVLLSAQHVPEVPLALGDLDPREYGPWAYRLAWQPPGPYELEVERPSGVHVVARGRGRLLVSRLAAVLHGRLPGVLVDDGGFVVRDHDLDDRLAPSAAPSSSLWG